VAVPCNERIENIVLLDRTNLIFVVVYTGLIAEYILPWAAIWLSDIFFFDIPPWLLWLLIGGPLAFSLLAIPLHWALRRWSKQPFRP
jgi:hypothetical protein